jgi:hypothetical protein
LKTIIGEIIKVIDDAMVPLDYIGNSSCEVLVVAVHVE